MLWFLTMIISVAVVSYTNGSDEKRILLSDPQYIQQELTRFQSELQEIQVKYNAQNANLVDLQTKYNTQNANLVDLQTKYNAQNTMLTSQNKELAELRVKYNVTVMSLQAKVTTLENAFTLQGDKGAVFTRWGRSDCPANVTTMVYSGTAGGSYYTNTGAAAEYVCMPDDPIWGPHKNMVYDGTVGYIYGAEYETPSALFGMSDYAEDVPCAICLGEQYTASLMIPGRTQCYPGWTELYHGNLASGYHGHAAASQYVCVDEHAQAIQGGGTHNENGKLFYGVKAKCGSLPCPPYEDGKFLSCVVCMK